MLKKQRKLKNREEFLNANMHNAKEFINQLWH
jgi:hypothetical protein